MFEDFSTVMLPELVCLLLLLLLLRPLPDSTFYSYKEKEKSITPIKESNPILQITTLVFKKLTGSILDLSWQSKQLLLKATSTIFFSHFENPGTWLTSKLIIINSLMEFSISLVDRFHHISVYISTCLHPENCKQTSQKH